jgi:hypothetical protein
VLFSGLQERDPIRYNVYAAQLLVASKARLIDEIPTALDQVKEWLDMWECDADGKRHIYRLLYNSLFDEHLRYVYIHCTPNCKAIVGFKMIEHRS